jgi:hypothetical protein
MLFRVCVARLCATFDGHRMLPAIQGFVLQARADRYKFIFSWPHQ